MGVSGSGKTTVGRAVARRLGWRFLEGDTLHPPENVAKMSAGHPLDDEDRAPWLAAIAAHIDEWRREDRCGVVACSALKRDYRKVVAAEHRDLQLVYLRGSRPIIAERLAARRGHFMPAGLLDSQFATLEPPRGDENAIEVDVDVPVDAIVARIVTGLRPTGTIPGKRR
jgi:carbohydrate kinase (thermoresistant glucokinase family)